MFDKLKSHTTKLALAFALLTFVTVFPAAAQEPEKQSEKQKESVRSAEQSPPLHTINLTLLARSPHPDAAQSDGDHTIGLALPALSTKESKTAPVDHNSTLFPWTATSNASKAPQSGDEWQFHLTPYIWFASLKGKLDVADLNVPFDAPFSETFENLNFAFMMTFGARKGRWALATDLMFINLGTENTYTDRLILTASEVNNKLFMLGPEVAYRVAETENASLDILGGFRYWHNSLDFEITRRILDPIVQSQSENWVDPLIGMRTRFLLGRGWNVTFNGDIGGFGAGSDFAWQAYGGVAKSFKKRFSFLFGYRVIDLQWDESNLLRRLTFYGPVIGMGVRFGAIQ